MNKNEYKFKTVKAVYGLSNNAALLILDIEFGINDYVIYKESWSNKLHKVKIYDSATGSYFKWNNWRIKLNECMRTNI